MRDVELVLRWFSYRNFAPKYNGVLKDFLDQTTKFFNANWDSLKDDLSSQSSEFEASLAATRAIFGERDELRKWNGSNFENRINRAVFDVMTYYFADEKIRLAALNKAAEVKSAFQKECENNRDFLSSLETTTKSIDANRTRFSYWAQALSRVTGVAVQSPMQ